MFADQEIVKPNKEKVPGELVEKPVIHQPIDEPGLLNESK